jgi:hypothetical protein
MIRWMLVFFVPVLLAGCISSSNPTPPPSTTIVVPQGSTAVCSDGQMPPC